MRGQERGLAARGYATCTARRWAERITLAAKPLPKNVVLNCLQELETKGYVRRKARDKAAGYFITRLV